MTVKKIYLSYQSHMLSKIEELERQMTSNQMLLDHFASTQKSYTSKPDEEYRNNIRMIGEKIEKLRTELAEKMSASQLEPVAFFEERRTYRAIYIERLWVYQDIVYQVGSMQSVEEDKLLILDFVDKERRKFERLKRKLTATDSENLLYERLRIPEEVRIAVWRRDQGRCARCGSRENLEYDHIVPVSKGGSNTARNIELLCQNCNRAKGNRIE